MDPTAQFNASSRVEVVLQNDVAISSSVLSNHQKLPMMGIVRYQEKWYSRNNRRLWCFEEANVETVGGLHDLWSVFPHGRCVHPEPESCRDM